MFAKYDSIKGIWVEKIESVKIPNLVGATDLGAEKAFYANELWILQTAYQKAEEAYRNACDKNKEEETIQKALNKRDNAKAIYDGFVKFYEGAVNIRSSEYNRSDFVLALAWNSNIAKACTLSGDTASAYLAILGYANAYAEDDKWTDERKTAYTNVKKHVLSVLNSYLEKPLAKITSKDVDKLINSFRATISGDTKTGEMQAKAKENKSKFMFELAKWLVWFGLGKPEKKKTIKTENKPVVF